MKVWHYGDNKIIHMYVQELDTEFFFDKDFSEWFPWSVGKANVFSDWSMIEVSSFKEARELVLKLYPEYLL